MGSRIVTLTIGGSDSCGCAGVQVDLRVFARLQTFGLSAVTAVTAQTVDRVTCVEPVSRETVRAQLDAALGWPVAAAKTGMLATAEVVQEVVRAARDPRFSAALVVDPVLASSSGTPLLSDEGLELLRQELLPRAALVTPNLDEAARLLGGPVDELEPAARELSERLGCAVLLKGGHLAGDPVDLLWWRGRAYRHHHPRALEVNPRGTGCLLSAAITARLALGDPLDAACAAGVAFTARALERPLHVEGGGALPGIEGA